MYAYNARAVCSSVLLANDQRFNGLITEHFWTFEMSAIIFGLSHVEPVEIAQCAGLVKRPYAKQKIDSQNKNQIETNIKRKDL